MMIVVNNYNPLMVKLTFCQRLNLTAHHQDHDQ